MSHNITSAEIIRDEIITAIEECAERAENPDAWDAENWEATARAAAEAGDTFFVEKLAAYRDAEKIAQTLANNIMQAESFDDLVNALKAYDDHNNEADKSDAHSLIHFDDFPTFGPEPKDTNDILSWDNDRIMLDDRSVEIQTSDRQIATHRTHDIPKVFEADDHNYPDLTNRAMMIRACSLVRALGLTPSNDSDNEFAPVTEEDTLILGDDGRLYLYIPHAHLYAWEASDPA